MKLNIYQLISGAQSARGLTVVIDVFRAFTTACYIVNNGAEKLLPVGNVEQAYALKKAHPEYILVGERNEVMLPGFDYGNSPANIEHVNFSGKTIVHTTSAGTQGIVNAFHADEIITGSFANGPAIAKYILKTQPEEVSFVCMGKAALAPTEEDTACAEYIKSLILGEPYDLESKIKEIRQGEGKRFFIPENQEQCPERDFILSTQSGTFDFILKAVKEDGLFSLKKIEIH